MNENEVFIRAFMVGFLIASVMGAAIARILYDDVKGSAVKQGHAIYVVTDEGEVEFKWLPACRKNP